uniref:CHK kinase-like domain-containing protein n=1 Tax=Strongyloides stercoralis TaxID=6248 RepID=A0AAF5D2F6_STRER
MDCSNLFFSKYYENSFVENSTITYKWIIENLQKNSEIFRLKRKDAKISKISFEDISVGKGFASNVFKTIVYFDTKDKSFYEFILKVPFSSINLVLNDLGLKDEKKKDSDITKEILVKLHSQECLFYTQISNEIKDLKTPECYGAREIIPYQSSGAIIMEFIDTSKAGIVPIQYSYNIDQTKSVIEEIFKLHVFSFTNGKHWKSKLQYKTNIELATIVHNIIAMQWENCKKIIPKSILLEIQEDFECLLSHFPEITLYHIYHLPEAQGNNAVICHGDMWINNIMFSKDSKGRFTNDVKAILDWQVIYEGAIGVDLARHLAVNCYTDTRREIENEFFPEYFDRLKNEVIKNGESFDMSYETFKRIYNFCYIDQFFHIITTIGIFISQLDALEENNRYENLTVEGFKIKYGWMLECLQNNCENFVLAKGNSKVLEIKISDISDGKGYISHVYKSSVYFDDKTKKPFEFAFKIPTTTCLKVLSNDSSQALNNAIESNFIIDAHYNEYIFYTYIAKEIDSIKIPLYYGGCPIIPHKQDGIIMMDILTSRASCVPYYKFLTINQVKSVLKEIMNLQVFSLTNGKHWRSKLKKLLSDQKVILFIKHLCEKYWSAIKNSMPNFMLHEIIDDCEILISNFEKIIFHNFKILNEKYDCHPVICHYDLWINNLMFTLDSENEISNDVEAIIDWQTTCEGNICCDIARLIVTGCSGETRRELEQSYLKEYFNKLKENVIKRGETFTMTYETFHLSYDFCLIEQALSTVSLVGHQILLANNSNENKYIWNARIFYLNSKVYFAVKDAINKVKILKPEWLEKKNDIGK